MKKRLISAFLLISISCGESQAQQNVVARTLFPPRNYELALGDSVIPRARVWNNGTQGSVPFDLNFYIKNVVTGIHVYYRIDTVLSIAPGDSLDIEFPAYYSNSGILSQLGTFDACLVIGQDTLHASCSRLFGIRRTATPFRDPSDNYSNTSAANIPDQTIWVSVGSNVVDGDGVTWDPPPPRDDQGSGNDGFKAPMICLDRKDETGKLYSGNNAGDTLTSFPINMQGKTRMVFNFEYMRGGRISYPLDWDKQRLLGPEGAVVNANGNTLRAGDSLILEFRNPSVSVTNPPPDGWNEIAAIPGGHDFEFKSFFATPIAGGWQITADGNTTTKADTTNYFTADFRFRFRLNASDDSHGQQPPDDADTWYIDNPDVEPPLLPELATEWVRVVNPYPKVPQSQAIFPVCLNVFDYGASNGPGCPFRVNIIDPNGVTVYSELENLNNIVEGNDSTLAFPNWDARSLPISNGEYTVTGAMAQPGFDDYSNDDSTYSKFYVHVESGPSAIQEFALDDAGVTPGPAGGNDIPTLSGIAGSGIGFKGTSGSLAMKFQLAEKDTLLGVRLYFGSANQSTDNIRISLYNGDPTTCTPLDTVAQPGIQSVMIAPRGGGSFNEFWPYYFPHAIVLDKGTYWIAVSQLSPINMDLGGDISRGGGEITISDLAQPQILSMYSDPYGAQWGPNAADNNGDIGCSFAMETPAGSGEWQPLMPSRGWWPALSSSSELTPTIGMPMSLPWAGAGTYVPMIRPMFATSFPSGVQSGQITSEFGVKVYPNPIDPGAAPMTIAYDGTFGDATTITIYNIMGAVVRTLSNSSTSSRTALWDGRDAEGNILPRGIYMISLSSAGRHAEVKAILQ